MYNIREKIKDMGNYSLKNVTWEKMDNHATYFENIVTDYPFYCLLSIK